MLIMRSPFVAHWTLKANLLIWDMAHGVLTPLFAATDPRAEEMNGKVCRDAIRQSRDLSDENLYSSCYRGCGLAIIEKTSRTANSETGFGHSCRLRSRNSSSPTAVHDSCSTLCGLARCAGRCVLPYHDYA